MLIIYFSIILQLLRAHTVVRRSSAVIVVVFVYSLARYFFVFSLTEKKEQSFNFIVNRCVNLLVKNKGYYYISNVFHLLISSG